MWQLRYKTATNFSSLRSNKHCQLPTIDLQSTTPLSPLTDTLGSRTQGAVWATSLKDQHWTRSSSSRLEWRFSNRLRRRWNRTACSHSDSTPPKWPEVVFPCSLSSTCRTAPRKRQTASTHKWKVLSKIIPVRAANRWIHWPTSADHNTRVNRSAAASSPRPRKGILCTLRSELSKDATACLWRTTGRAALAQFRSARSKRPKAKAWVTLNLMEKVGADSPTKARDSLKINREEALAVAYQGSRSQPPRGKLSSHSPM